MAVWFELGGDRVNTGKAEPIERSNDVLPADTVHRCVDDTNRPIARCGWKALRDFVKILVEHLLTDGPGGGTNDLRSRDFRSALHGGDRLRYLRVGRRDDLRSVDRIHLVSVVGGGIVRCGDNDRGDAAEAQGGIGHEWSWNRILEVANLEPGADEHGDRVIHERRGGEPGVATHNNGTLVGPGCGEEIVGQASCCPDHRRAVHPVGSGLHAAA